VRNHFRISIGGKFVPFAFQARTQRLVILDDAVMHDGQPTRNVGMRIAFTGHAVRRPAGMGNARIAAGLRRLGLRREFRHPADRTEPMQPPGIDQGQSGRIVAAIFEATQTFEKDGNDIAVSDRGDDATHD